GRPGQPVRETGLRDHPAGRQARAARRRRQATGVRRLRLAGQPVERGPGQDRSPRAVAAAKRGRRSEEHTSELQSRSDLVCRLLLEKKKQTTDINNVLKKIKSRKQ